MIERAQALEKANDDLHRVLWNFDQQLQKNFMGMSDIEQFIHSGRLHETGKRDVILADIEAKAARCKEILAVKEELEVNMAPAGVVNHIYSNLNTIQEELRNDIMTFVSHKSAMVSKLEEMLRTFKDSNLNAIEQAKEQSREAAKNRAFDCILNTKMISNKILAEIYQKAGGEKPQQRESERFTYDANQFEAALEEKFSEETFQKNREIKRLQDAIAAKDRNIADIREKLAAQIKDTSGVDTNRRDTNSVYDAQPSRSQVEDY